MEPGDVVQLVHESSDRTPVPGNFVVESAASGGVGDEGAVMFRAEGTEHEYLYMSSSGEAGTHGDASGPMSPHRAFTPTYHARPDAEHPHLEPVVSLRGVAASHDHDARAPTMGSYLGMKGGQLVGMVGLGAESRMRVKKVGHTRVPDTPEPAYGEPTDFRTSEPQAGNKHTEFGSFAAKGEGKHSMGRGA